MTFKLKSGNRTPFKMMGSSPVKQDEKEDTRTGEVKKLDATLDQIDRAKLYQASQKDQLTRETTGTRGTELKKSYLEAKTMRGKRGAKMNRLVEVVNTKVPVTTVTSKTPSDWLDRNTQLESLPPKERKKRYEFLQKQNSISFGEDYSHSLPGGDHSSVTTYDPEKNIETTAVTTTLGKRAPKVDMPTISLEQKTPELNTTPPEPVVKKAKLPPELRPEKKKVKKKRAKVKRVKRPKRTSTRNLVTGGKNRTRRSTGTSKRR